MIKTIIFDMDGVLVDTEKTRFLILKKILKKRGILVEDHDYKKWMGMKLETIFSTFFSKTILPEYIVELRREKDAIKEADPKKYVIAFQGLYTCLDRLIKQGFNLVLASSSSKKNITFVLKTLNIAHFFQVIISSDDIAHQKPAPDIYLLAIKKSSQKPNECLVIEDSKLGLESAKKAGVKCIAVTNSFSKKELSKADGCIASLDELTKEYIQLLS